MRWNVSPRPGSRLPGLAAPAMPERPIHIARIARLALTALPLLAGGVATPLLAAPPLAPPPAPVAAAPSPSPSIGQPGTAAPRRAIGLADALAAAWQRHPAARALSARLDAFAAREDAAASLLAESPSLAASNRSDKLNRNAGVAEWDVSLALPLWLPGYQSRTLALVESERDAFAALVDQARWRLAGEVREAYWLARLAENERIVANRRAEDAARLSEDVRRRVAAGELAPMDLNQARGAEQAALAAQADGEARAHRARLAFSALTGLGVLPEESAARESAVSTPALAPAAPSTASAPLAADDAGFDAPLDGREAAHPALSPLVRAIEAARSRLALARGNVRDAPELTVGVRRERDSFDGPWLNSATVGVRIPLSTGARNRPRIAAASAELTEAEATLPLERARLAAEQDASAREVEQSAVALARAEQRLALAVETQREYARAFQLGNIDLPQRLRIEFDRFDAELAAARARIEAARAVARHNQSLGLLP